MSVKTHFIPLELKGLHSYIHLGLEYMESEDWVDLSPGQAYVLSGFSWLYKSLTLTLLDSLICLELISTIGIIFLLISIFNYSLMSSYLSLFFQPYKMSSLVDEIDFIGFLSFFSFHKYFICIFWTYKSFSINFLKSKSLHDKIGLWGEMR